MISTIKCGNDLHMKPSVTNAKSPQHLERSEMTKMSNMCDLNLDAVLSPHVNFLKKGSS